MRPAYTKPSRRLLQVAAAMYQPLHRKVPIVMATSPKHDERQLDLEVDHDRQIGRAESDPRK